MKIKLFTIVLITNFITLCSKEDQSKFSSRSIDSVKNESNQELGLVSSSMISINDGAESTDSLNVTVNISPDSGLTNKMKIRSGKSCSGASWQNLKSSVDITLSAADGDLAYVSVKLKSSKLGLKTPCYTASIKYLKSELSNENTPIYLQSRIYSESSLGFIMYTVPEATGEGFSYEYSIGDSSGSKNILEWTKASKFINEGVSAQGGWDESFSTSLFPSEKPITYYINMRVVDPSGNESAPIETNFRYPDPIGVESVYSANIQKTIDYIVFEGDMNLRSQILMSTSMEEPGNLLNIIVPPNGTKSYSFDASDVFESLESRTDYYIVVRQISDSGDPIGATKMMSGRTLWPIP